MVTFKDLQIFFNKKDYKIIIAADAEPIVHTKVNSKFITSIPAGGVAVAFSPIALACGGLFVARGKSIEDKETVDSKGKLNINTNQGAYILKRIFLSDDELSDYYYGFSNQTLWPLCHMAFEKPSFSSIWYEGYKKVNQKFAEAINEEITDKTLIWINDYQLALVPKYLGKLKNVTIAIFWHIPWPPWEIFRILPQKKEILESILLSDIVCFHRRYQRRNFLSSVEHELEARIDRETNRIYYKNRVTKINNLPMGVDSDVINSLIEPEIEDMIFNTNANSKPNEKIIEAVFKETKVLLGVDRLDYTKGLLLRLQAVEIFFENNPQYIGKISYIGIIAPSREKIPSYVQLLKQIQSYSELINKKYGLNNWKPITLVYETFSRKEIIELYRKSSVCLVTPLDDGMNLVSKEFILSAEQAKNPGMLVLSQFAGSSIDLTESIIVNPYDVDEVAKSIKKALEMSKKEKEERIKIMAEILKVRNIYDWAEKFILEAEAIDLEKNK